VSRVAYVRKGDRIKLMHTNDPYTKLQRGTLGTVTSVNLALGQINVKWDDGSTLSLIPETGDDFDIVEAS
jgi:hypothetical protein